MDRREFLRNCLAAGIGVGLAGFPFSGARQLGALAHGAEPPSAASTLPDIVAVRNGEPDLMFDRGIAAMGGMGRFVKKGQKVTIKPNVSWDVGIDMAGNTNPALLRRIVKHCLEAGAAKVTVFDNCIEHWQRCYDVSGIGEAARDAGAIIAPAEAERYYQKHNVGGKTLKEAMVHEAVFDCDVLISVPILKHHGGAGMTGGIKNFMGAVWDRRFYHRAGLQQCIADYLLVRKPDLTIIDAYRVLMSNGPRSRSAGDVRLTKMQILSTDVVTADASGARILGRDPESYAHIRIAHEMGLGEIDPSRLDARRISL